MNYLILNLIFVCGFSLITKQSQVAGRNMLAVGAINYIVAAVASAIAAAPQLGAPVSQATWITGIVCGVTYVTSFWLMMRGLRRNGISVTWSTVRLSVFMSVLFSILYAGERPGALQIVGMAAVLLALPLLSMREGKGTRGALLAEGLFIGLLFLSAGGTNLAAKAFDVWGPESERSIYALVLFVVAALMSTAGLWRSGSRISLGDVWAGLALGLVNLGATQTLLLALNALPGIVVFPVTSAASIIVTSLAGMALWREKLAGEPGGHRDCGGSGGIDQPVRGIGSEHRIARMEATWL